MHHAWNITEPRSLAGSPSRLSPQVWIHLQHTDEPLAADPCIEGLLPVLKNSLNQWKMRSKRPVCSEHFANKLKAKWLLHWHGLETWPYWQAPNPRFRSRFTHLQMGSESISLPQNLASMPYQSWCYNVCSLRFRAVYFRLESIKDCKT